VHRRRDGRGGAVRGGLIRRAGLLLAAAFLAAGAAPAEAACPALVPAPSFLESLVKHAPAAGTLTDAQILDLIRRGEVTVPPLLVSPPRGPAPLKVDIGWQSYEMENAARVEVDLDGDGRYEESMTIDSGEGPFRSGHITRTYDREGEYEVTMRIVDLSGRASAATARLVVLSPARFDTEMQALWDDFKSALRARDVAGALDCARFQRTLEKVVDDRMPIDRILTSIRFVQMFGPAAEYEMLRTDERGELSYAVRFAVDTDGQWRLRAF
jgi:hypothetical protein